MMPKSIRGKLSIALFSLAFLALGITVINYYYNKRLESMHKHRLQLENVNLQILRTIASSRDFLTFDALNRTFFDEGKSNYIELHNKYISDAINSLEYLIYMSDYGSDVLIKEDLIDLNNEVVLYRDAFNGYTENLLKRGFDNQGIIRALNNAAKVLEKNTAISKADYLDIRLLEKYYLVQIDEESANALLQKLDDYLKDDGSFALSVNTLAKIKDYKQVFAELVRFDKYLGYRNEVGLSLKLKNRTEAVTSLSDEIAKNSLAIEDRIKKKLNGIFIILIAIQLILSFFLTFYLASFFSKPIETLSNALAKTVESGFSSYKKVKINYREDEMSRLMLNYNSFIEKLETTMNELAQAKDESEEINEVLKVLNKEIKANQQKLKDVIEVKDKMFQIFANDLRIPFINLSGFFEIIRTQADSLSSEELRDFGQVLQRSVSDLINLSTTLIQWGLSQSEGIKFNPVEMDVQKLFDQNIELQASNASSRLVAFTTSYEGETIIHSDPDILNFVLRNLIANALRYSKVGGEIALQFKNTKSQYRFVISDNGNTIPKENIKDLFRVKKQIEAHQPGNPEVALNIGLALCKEYIEIAEGEIFVDAQEGRGNIIYLDFIKLS